MNNSLQFNPGEIRRAISTLKPDGELFEVRIIRGNDVRSGYFNDAETLIRALQTEDLAKANVYFTLQRLHPGCSARWQYERFIDTGREKLPTTSDRDVIGYRFLPIDLDPVRPAGISSSDEELESAWDLRGQIMAYMDANGFDPPISGFSGNGYHLLYHYEMPGRTEPSSYVRGVLNRLDELFSNDFCKVDVTLFNPSRVIKLYGTVARKGRNTEERPHRLSFLYNQEEQKHVQAERG